MLALSITQNMHEVSKKIPGSCLHVLEVGVERLSHFFKAAAEYANHASASERPYGAHVPKDVPNAKHCRNTLPFQLGAPATKLR
eukprot:6199111-Pleurochrysis_carterae.AAC.1